MSSIDVNALLQDVEPTDPCGPDLEYDPDFLQLGRIARGKPEQQEGAIIVPGEEPNWPDVLGIGVGLLTRTKDLRVATLVCRALLNIEGLPGLSCGLELVRGLLERHWEQLHPKLDSEDGGDPTMRMNVVASLCDRDTFLAGVRKAPLVTSKVLGSYGLRDLQIAEQPFVPSEGLETPPIEAATIEGAFLDGDVEDLRSVCSAVESCLERIGGIESLLMERVGPAHAPDLQPLSGLCKEIHRVLLAKLALRGEGTSTSTAEAEGTGAGPEQADRVSGQIRGREDVIRVLEALCEYYARHEPSSPVPLLLQRAKRIVPKDFLGIMRDMAPDGLAQVEAIAGLGRGGGESEWPIKHTPEDE